VAIRASSARQIDALIADLAGDHAVKRESAVARLTVIGARAVDRLVALVESPAPAAARTAALRALEGIGSPRSLDPALRALTDREPAVAAAAAAVARGFLRDEQGAVVVDRLTAVAIDTRRDTTVRLAALRALADLERSTIAPLFDSLADDPVDAIRAAARQHVSLPRAAQEPADLLARAAEGALPDEAETLRLAVVQAGATAPLDQLLHVVERIREREGAEPAARRAAWMAARAAAHVALAERGSRLALYDLRESLETAKAPLPVEFLKALTIAGDASCLEAIAAAQAKARDAWWRQHLTDAFYAIAARERITARSAAMKRLTKRWPALDGGR
jgi:hypothetical protein